MHSLCTLDIELLVVISVNAVYWEFTCITCWCCRWCRELSCCQTTIKTPQYIHGDFWRLQTHLSVRYTYSLPAVSQIVLILFFIHYFFLNNFYCNKILSLWELIAVFYPVKPNYTSSGSFLKWFLNIATENIKNKLHWASHFLYNKLHHLTRQTFFVWHYSCLRGSYTDRYLRSTRVIPVRSCEAGMTAHAQTDWHAGLCKLLYWLVGLLTLICGHWTKVLQQIDDIWDWVSQCSKYESMSDPQKNQL